MLSIFNNKKESNKPNPRKKKSKKWVTKIIYHKNAIYRKIKKIKLAKALELPKVMNFSGYEGVRASFSKLASLVAAMGVLGLGNPMNASLGEGIGP